MKRRPFKVIQVFGKKNLNALKAGRFWLNFTLLWFLFMTLYIHSTVDHTAVKLWDTGIHKNLIQQQPYGAALVLKEELISQDVRTIVLKTIAAEAGYMAARIFVAKLAENSKKEMKYINLVNPHSRIYAKGLKEVSNQTNTEISRERKYFETLRTTTGVCRKLARMGGDLYCDSGKITSMEGHKLICVEPQFQIGTKNGKDCLILSFGVYTETSFDESIGGMNCDVHMFDIFNFETPTMKKQENLHFHLMGLAAKRSKFVYKTGKYSGDLYSLDDIVTKLELENKVINVLKLDIEGYEWSVLHDISLKPVVDIVGQIAVEVHADQLLSNLTSEEKLKEVRYWISSMKALEARGFRRVSYFDNVRSASRFNDTDGSQYELAGELLLVNTNWYSETFREEKRKIGYNFFQL